MKTFQIIISYVVSYGAFIAAGFAYMWIVALSQMFNTTSKSLKVDIFSGWEMRSIIVTSLIWIIVTVIFRDYFTRHLMVLVLVGVGLAIIVGGVAILDVPRLLSEKIEYYKL